MPILDHGPAAQSPPQSPETSARNARYGLVLFAVYLALYSGFVAINAFAPHVMERTIAGVNLAIWFGFGLIAAAFVLALVYGWLCRDAAPSSSAPHRQL
jgi:uncharacterized membrane protein (DUF485 family)